MPTSLVSKGHTVDLSDRNRMTFNDDYPWRVRLNSTLRQFKELVEDSRYMKDRLTGEPLELMGMGFIHGDMWITTVKGEHREVVSMSPDDVCLTFGA